MVDKVKSILNKASKLTERYRRFTDRRWPVGLLSDMEEYYHLQLQDVRRLLHHRRKVAKGNESLFVYDWPRARNGKTSIKSIEDIRKESDMVIFKSDRVGKRSIHVFRVNNSQNN